MGNADQSPLGLDLGYRFFQGNWTRDLLLEEESHNLAVGGEDLFSDDDGKGSGFLSL